MKNQNQLKQQIDSTQDLHSVVRTMKSLAAVNIHHFERASTSISEYNKTVELSLQILMRHLDEITEVPETDPEAPYAVFIFGSDQGMCGQFNEHIRTFSSKRIEERRGEAVLVSIGDRLLSHIGELGIHLYRHHPMTSSLSNITNLVDALIVDIFELRRQRGLERFYLDYNRETHGAAYEPHEERILPLDARWLEDIRQRTWETRMIPIYRMDYRRLFQRLLEEYLFVKLYRAIVDSLASENASRLSSMQAAERNIEDRLDELQMQYNQVRQAAITSEMLDIISGFEALTKK